MWSKYFQFCRIDQNQGFCNKCGQNISSSVGLTKSRAFATIVVKTALIYSVVTLYLGLRPRIISERSPRYIVKTEQISAVLPRFVHFASLLVIPTVPETFQQDLYTLPHFWSFLHYQKHFTKICTLCLTFGHFYSTLEIFYRDLYRKALVYSNNNSSLI